MHVVLGKHFFKIFAKFWSIRFRISGKSWRNVSLQLIIVSGPVTHVNYHNVPSLKGFNRVNTCILKSFCDSNHICPHQYALLPCKESVDLSTFKCTTHVFLIKINNQSNVNMLFQAKPKRYVFQIFLKILNKRFKISRKSERNVSCRFYLVMFTI